MLTKERDYLWARPALVANKMRALELQAGLPQKKGNQSTVKNATFGGALGIDELQGRFGAGMGASQAVARTAMMKTRQRAASQARSRRKL